MRLLALLLPIPLLAQTPRPSPPAVPVELVTALLGGMGTEPPELRVGALPPNVPRDLLPPDARVLGSLVQPGGVHDVPSTIVALSPRFPEDAADNFIEHLHARGWRSPPGMGQERGGFVGSTTTRPDLLCSDSGFVAVSATSRAEGGSHLRITYNRTRGYGPCDGRPRRNAVERDVVPLPQLAPPSGATVHAIGAGGGMDERSSSARLRTTMSAADVLRHFADQVLAQGWSATGPASVNAAGGWQVFELRREGQLVRGVLLVVTAPSGAEKDALFRAVREATR